jgi:tetratricopeptide (TPR) repeat protein
MSVGKNFMRVFFIAIALALASCGVADTDCGRIDDLDLAIRSCTILVEGQASSNVAVACTNRARAFDTKGDYDRAIADYDQTIRLNRNMRPPIVAAASHAARKAIMTASSISIRPSS